ncbi:hypothetical protein [Novipirellula caenicola]|uniref:Uncharacterized protein n=1 Tax=Novipirellula caenicola TaxID=1536901 RepID=A0ABP9W0Q7_9BACT
MKYKTTCAFALIAVTFIGLTTFRYALADEGDPAGHVNLQGLGDRPALVAFGTGGENGGDNTVLVNCAIVDIDGKRFLGGTVTDECPEVKVAFPGRTAYVALERIVYIQYLDAENPQDGG